jgi:hypothetical protein
MPLYTALPALNGIDTPKLLVVLGGKNGIMSAYDPCGKRLGDGKGSRTSINAVSAGAASAGGRCNDTQQPIHTVGIDEPHRRAWIVYAAHNGDFIEALRIAP